jgi:hypothetical protein
MENQFEMSLVKPPKSEKEKNAEGPKEAIAEVAAGNEGNIKEVPAFSWKAVFKGYETEEQGKGMRVAKFEGIGFSIPQKILEEIGLQSGDKIQVIKSEEGDLVEVTNLKNGESWHKDMEEIRKRLAA